MKHKPAFFLALFFIFIFLSPSYGKERFEFINPRDLIVTVAADKSEIKSGDTATFLISIKNRSEEPISLHFNRPWQFDLVCMRKGRQIYRHSAGLKGGYADYYISLAPGEALSKKLSWKTLNKEGLPTQVGVYTAFGMAVLAEKTLVSQKDCAITLLPAEVKDKEIIKASLNHYFDIELPKYANGRELKWHIEYIHNDNRLALYKTTRRGKSIIYTFKAKRLGHARFNLYAHKLDNTVEQSIERRSYLVEVR